MIFSLLVSLLVSFVYLINWCSGVTLLVHCNVANPVALIFFPMKICSNIFTLVSFLFIHLVRLFFLIKVFHT